MSDDFLGASAPAPAAPVAQRPGKRGGCLGGATRTMGTLLLIMVSGLLGAALALGALVYGPAKLGLTLPDGTGRIAALETAERTAVVERTDMAATLRGLSDVRGSLDSMRDRVQTLEGKATARETDLDSLQNQITTNLNTLLALQERLNQLESIPANAAISERLADAELELATVSSTLERLRQALGGTSAALTPAAPPSLTPPPATTPTATVAPSLTPPPATTPTATVALSQTPAASPPAAPTRPATTPTP